MHHALVVSFVVVELQLLKHQVAAERIEEYVLLPVRYLASLQTNFLDRRVAVHEIQDFGARNCEQFFIVAEVEHLVVEVRALIDRMFEGFDRELVLRESDRVHREAQILQYLPTLLVHQLGLVDD